jgi:glyoxylase-like metal-dependent hydrolase (beta-lactamase superfamily II)
MLIGAGGNITLQVGKDGVLLVDTSYAPMAPKIMAAIRTLSAMPIRYIVDTHMHTDHTGGNAALAKLGGGGAMPRIIANDHVLNRMSERTSSGQTAAPEADWPNDEYFNPTKDFFFNNEAVVVYHMPAAHTDGDSVVFFRRSDVISAGDIFTPNNYPFLDLARGGSVQGEIDALNHILELTVPAKYQEGGTYVIPGHGRLCEEADVVEYRDMVTIIRDRVQDLIRKGKTLEQVKAAKPSLDYDTQYGTAAGAGDRFVEAVYKSLGGK